MAKAAKTKTTKTAAKPGKRAVAAAAKTTTKNAAAKTTTKSAATKPAKTTKASATKTAARVPAKPSKSAGGPSAAMPMLGQAAPALELAVAEGDDRTLARFKGKSHVVLYFYPKDDTPGCTKQACAFQKDLAKLQSAGAVVIGVSPDTHASHTRFRTKYGLDFLLAADEGAAAARVFGVWVEKNMYGRKYMGVQRATFLIDKGGRIAAVWPKVQVDGHSADVLAALRELA